MRLHSFWEFAEIQGDCFQMGSPETEEGHESNRHLSKIFLAMTGVSRDERFLDVLVLSECFL